MVAEATGDQPKMTKMISMEDEVARLTIEVGHGERNTLFLSHAHTHTHIHTLSLSHTHTHTLSLSLTHTHTQTMSVDDFATMLAYLVRVCWSAAAGQLHLASISDSQPPSPAQPRSRGNRETTPTSLMDRASSESDGGSRITQLRAGLCLQQEADSVSSKVHVYTCTGTLYMYIV